MTNIIFVVFFFFVVDLLFSVCNSFFSPLFLCALLTRSHVCPYFAIFFIKISWEREKHSTKTLSKCHSRVCDTHCTLTTVADALWFMHFNVSVYFAFLRTEYVCRIRKERYGLLVQTKSHAHTSKRSVWRMWNEMDFGYVWPHPKEMLARVCL